MPRHSHLLVRRSAWLWPWAGAFSPALLVLVMLWPLRVPVPYLDEWAFVQQYQAWVEGRYNWGDFFELHYVHPSAVGKATYFAVLHWLGGDVGLLPLLTWTFSAFIAACICRLSRPLWRGNHVRGAVLMFLASLTVFSAAQGEVWVWAFLFQNSIPGVCLAAGLVVLSSGVLSARRVVGAAVLCVVATFSFGSGVLVGLLLSMLIWHGMPERSLTHRCLATGAWLAFNGVVAWFALSAPSASDVSNSIKPLLDYPFIRLQFVLVLLGQVLGKGTVFEPQVLCAVLGSAFVLVFAACGVYVFRRRRDRKLVSASLPWLACCLYGLGNAVLICLGRSGGTSFTNALDARYAAFTLFFVVGTVLLSVAVMVHGDAIIPLMRWMRKASWPALTVFLVAQPLNWERGWQTMKLWNKNMAQERAMLAFAQVMPRDSEWMEERQTRRSAFRMMRFLAATDRLQGVTFAPDNRMASFARDGELRAEWARFDKPLLLDDGCWSLGGLGGVSSATAADLILITAESPVVEEQIIALAAPLLSDSFYERRAERRKHPEHYLGWKHTLTPQSLPGGTLTLRAYVFDPDQQRVRPMEGMHKVEGPSR